MRIIKFRAWLGNEMIYDPIIYGIRGNQMAIGASINEGIVEFIEDGEGKYVLMQFTGLLDKNCKEIYEGDILWCEKSYWEDKKYRVVRWDDSDSCFYFRNENDSVDSDSPKKSLACSFIHESQREIIGNIYETPELLNPPSKGVE